MTRGARLSLAANGRKSARRGAFSRSTALSFALDIPRAWGVWRGWLRVFADGGDKPLCRIPLRFRALLRGRDRFLADLSPAALCGGEASGLFYYDLALDGAHGSLFSDTADNASLTFLPHPARPFRLLVFEDGFTTPARLAGRTIYHIFVDRFAKGESLPRPGTRRHAHWDEEIEQFAMTPGAPVANNEFFGGTLGGIVRRLDDLAALGVGALYLSPVFRAASNHKYDTGDYGEIDPDFGGEAAFADLLAACRARDIDVILDGVFNHTGDDSRYFNRYGHYAEVGAYQSQRSKYADWYTFRRFPDDYLSWWGIDILPKLNLENPAVRDYLLDAVARRTREGVAGWRLDVADELPDGFLDAFRRCVKAHSGGNGVIFGEVWENAADKVAYGRRRRYLRGRQLDSVMNYPLREGLLRFVREGDAPALARVLVELWSSYPPQVCRILMNLLSTHDTPRALTLLGEEGDGSSLSPVERRDARLPPAARARGVRRLMMASALQYTVYGVPSLYYGDEAGLEGYGDPFCRRPYPYGREDASLLAHYRRLGAIRRAHPSLRGGDFALVRLTENALAFTRTGGGERLVVAANRGDTPLDLHLPRPAVELLTGRLARGRVRVAPDEIHIWRMSLCSDS